MVQKKMTILFFEDFFGMVTGCIGSLVIEKFLKWRKKLNAEPQKEYIKAEQKDKQVRELSTINNMYRTYTAVTLCLILTYIFSLLWPLIKEKALSKPALVLAGCIILIFVFGKSYIKQTNYVANRIKTINELNKEDNQGDDNEDKI